MRKKILKPKKVKLIKNKCEIETCNVTNPKLLHLHHWVERTELNTNNSNLNLVILCSNCHTLLHSGGIKIIGIYPSTDPPNYRTVIYEIDGKRNIEGIDKPYITFKPKAFKLHDIEDNDEEY